MFYIFLLFSMFTYFLVLVPVIFSENEVFTNLNLDVSTKFPSLSSPVDFTLSVASGQTCMH